MNKVIFFKNLNHNKEGDTKTHSCYKRKTEVITVRVGVSVRKDGWCYVAREGLQVIEALKFKLKDLNTWRLGGEIKRMFAFQSEQHE